MERPLSRALLLLVLLGPTVGAGRSDMCRLDTYGALLPDNPRQCPSRLDASGESSLHRAPASPGKARAADPPAKETSRPWIPLGASAQKVTRSPNDQHDGPLFMEGEECNKWIHGQVVPVETFSCPTEKEKWKLFCCGTCTASYCCSSRKKRLKQESCPEAVKGPEDQEAEDHTEPTDTVSNLDFVFVAGALSTIFTTFLCSLKWWMERREKQVKQRMVNAQLDLVRGIQAVPVTDTPQPVRPVSTIPDVVSLGDAESQNPSGWPTAVANAPCGSGNPIQERSMSPAFAQGREERETLL